jgi:predicted ATP-dependent serine protease
MTGVRLVGLDGETDMIVGLLEDIRDRDGALVVAGEPGVGKSALLMASAEMATDRGLLVLRTAGVQSEMNLPFAALHKILRRVLAQAENVPLPQRNAIQAAFAMADAAAPDLFLIASKPIVNEAVT